MRLMLSFYASFHTRYAVRIAAVLLAIGVLTPQLTGQTRADCLACHSDESLTTERNGREHSLYVRESTLNASPHAKLVCVACHTGFNPEDLPHKEKITPVNCRTCHANAPLKHAFHPRMATAKANDDGDDVRCVSCHGTHDVRRAHGAPGKDRIDVADVCATCHGDVIETYALSAHGKATADHVQGAPSCLTCHSADIVDGTDDVAAVKQAQEQLCLSCHLDDEQVRSRMTPSAGFIRAYESSVHGSALHSGNGKAANCVDCHGSHEMSKASSAGSRVAKSHIPETCSQCHASIAETYAQSSHGVAFSRGVKEAPVCTDCHGEHNILGPGDPNSPVAAANVSAQVCSPCHSSVRLTDKFGIASDRYETFSDSYHGLAISAKSVAAANCASCHGAHNIKNSADPGSTVNKANLATTCGKCHPGANERFSVGSVHVNIASEQEEPLLYWIATAYILMIIGVIGGMTVHNLLDFRRKAKRKLMARRGLIVEERLAHRLYVRMTLSERLQHATLLVSFTLLVFTGFALRFPNAWWVATVRDISPLMFDIRGIVHRIAAVVMVGASLYHLYYIFVVPRGKALVRDLLPRWSDLTDARDVLRYNLGLIGEKPQFGRFSYIEKSEYWALVWGTIVMGVTGVILWFDNTFLGLLTKLGWDVARTIHYYEAWLATLAIVVWHFYFVIFNPDVYPINLAFWKGTLTEEEMADEHPLELQALLASQALKVEGTASDAEDPDNSHNRESEQ